MSFTSPKAIKKLFNPSPKQMDDGNRVEAFRRYISDLEKKGGGEVSSLLCSLHGEHYGRLITDMIAAFCLLLLVTVLYSIDIKST